MSVPYYAQNHLIFWCRQSILHMDHRVL